MKSQSMSQIRSVVSVLMVLAIVLSSVPQTQASFNLAMDSQSLSESGLLQQPCGVGEGPGVPNKVTQAFVAAYARNGGTSQLGLPTNCVHEWWADRNINEWTQDFPETANWGKTLIVWNNIQEKAYVIHGWIMEKYADTWDESGQKNGPGSWLGAPVSDETIAPDYFVAAENDPNGHYPWSFGGEPISYFERGFISRKQGEGNFSAHTYFPAICDVRLIVADENGKAKLNVTTRSYRAPGYPNANNQSDPYDVYFVVVKSDGSREWREMTENSITSFSLDWSGLPLGEVVYLYLDAWNRRGQDQGWKPKYSSYPQEVVLSPDHIDQGDHQWHGSKDVLKSLKLVSGAEVRWPNDNPWCDSGSGVVNKMKIIGNVSDGITDTSNAHSGGTNGSRLADLKVELLYNEAVIESTSTDSNGEYKFENLLAAPGYSVRVSLQNRQGSVENSASPGFALLFGSTKSNNRIQHGDVIQVLQNVSKYSIPTTVINFNFSNRNNLTVLPVAFSSLTMADDSNLLDDAGAIYYHEHQVVEFIAAAPFNKRFPTYVSVFSPLTTGAYACRGGDLTSCRNGNYVDIVLGEGRASHYNDSSRPMNREWHETFHGLMHFAQTMPQRDCANHGGICNSTTGDSWLEGYAMFWAMVIGKEKNINGDWYDGIADLERDSENWTIWTSWGTNSGEDVAVAALLYDLYDSSGKQESYKVIPHTIQHVFNKVSKFPSNTVNCSTQLTQTTYVDNIQLTKDQLWGNIVNPANAQTIKDLYDRLTNQAPQLGYTTANLDNIFKLHGFFNDSNNNCIYDVGEEVGVTIDPVHGNPPRHNTPIIPKANVLVNVMDQTGVPSTAQLVAEITFVDTGEQHEIQINLGTPSQLVSLGIPPFEQQSRIRIYARQGAQTSDVLTFENTTFWHAIDNVKNGFGFDYLHNYLGEYTFTLGGTGTIPFDPAPPLTVQSVSGQQGKNGWHLSEPVTVTLNPIDTLSGVERTEYKINSGSWLTYTGNFTAAHGDTVYYHAIDWLGNVEPIQQTMVQVDTTTPTSTVTLSPIVEPTQVYTTAVTAALSGLDGGPSGLGHLAYRLNGGAWLAYTIPFTISQNGVNTLEYHAIDIAGNVEPVHIMTVTLDQTTYTIIPLDRTQINRRAAMGAIVKATLVNQHPLMAMQSFTVTGTTYPTGTVILLGEIAGNFSRQVHVGPLALPPASVLYPQTIALFDSASLDERASWELPDLRKALETYLGLHEWPVVNETTIASELTPQNVLFFPSGITPDVLQRFDSGVINALRAQVEAGAWVVFQGDATLLAEKSGLVPTGTVAANALGPGCSAPVPVQPESLLTYNWPSGMTLVRYNDAPRFYLTESDMMRVANYADNNEAAIVLRRVGQGGVILIGGHASADELAYGVLYHALFTAAARQLDSRVSVEQQFMPGTPPDVVPGFEPDVPVLIRTTVANHGNTSVSSFAYTEVLTSGYRLLGSPVTAVGTVLTSELATGTFITWTVETLLPGEHELRVLVSNVNTDTLKPGDVTISQASFSFIPMDSDQSTPVMQLTRPAAVVKAMSAALIAHNPIDEPDNTYPLPAAGFYRHIREDLENKLDTRSNNTFYTVTVPLVDIVRNAFDQTDFPTIKHYGWYRPIVITDVEETHAFVVNTIQGYPDRNYVRPAGTTQADWSLGLEDWDGLTWVRIPNPHHTFVHIPIEYKAFIIQEPGNGDILVPGLTLSFDLGTLLPYDQREPAIRYMIHSQELFGRGISFSVEPVADTLVLEGNGGSVYTAVGQHPVPFREYVTSGNVNNPIAPVPSEITYTDLWGREHLVTETVRSSFYDIIPYAHTGEAVGVRVASTYRFEDETGNRLFDFPTYRPVTLTIMLKAKSLNRTLSPEQMILQEMLPRGLGYDIEFVTWASSNGSFHLLNEQTMRQPAFNLLNFQGDLPSDEAQTIIITARLRTYPGHPREGSFLVDGGARIATQNEWGNISQYDTDWTHARIEQGYQPDLQIEKLIASPDVSRQGGLVYEMIRLDGTADVQRFTEEVYIDSAGTGDKTAVVRTGGSRGPNLYFGTVLAGGKTLLTLEVTNNSGQDWHQVTPTFTVPAGITLTPIMTDGLEPPPNVYDMPYLWANEIPDVSRGVYIYEVQVDSAVEPGVMYPITFALAGANVPSAGEFPLPVARIGVGGNVQRIMGQAQHIELTDRSPLYADPVAAKKVTLDQVNAFQTITLTEQRLAFFDALTTTVAFTTSVPVSSTERLITYTLSPESQTLPVQQESAIQSEWWLLVQTQIGLVEPGTRLVNYGPSATYQDDFGTDWQAQGNATNVIAHGPVLTGTYSVLSITSPFYGGVMIDPLPGEPVDVCVDIAVRNIGNYRAATPVITATANLTNGIQLVSVVPTPTSIISGVISWQLPDILPYGASGNPDQDVEHMQVCLGFTLPEVQQRLALLQDPPFYVPLLINSFAEYTDVWGQQPFIVFSPLGGEYGLRAGSSALSAPDLYQATWRDNRTVALAWHGVPDARDYVVYRSTQPDRDFRPVGPVVNGTEHISIVWDDPLAQTYYYTIRARDANQIEGRHSQVLRVSTTRPAFRIYLPLVTK